MEKIVCLFGPTCSGKSQISVKIAKEFDLSVISADSMQVYKGMDIGTAKIQKEEQNKVSHYLIDIVEPNEYYSTNNFFIDAGKIIKDELSKNKSILITGGTGLYFKALFNGIYNAPGKSDEIRNKLENDEKNNPGILFEKLKNIDPDYSKKIHPNDLKRTIRALEIFELCGKSISNLQNDKLEYDYLKIGLMPDRDKLYKKINERCENMIKEGIVEETRKLIEKYGKDHNCFKAIGYSHAIKLIENKTSFEEFERTFKRDTRRFAKRQYTLFKNFNDVHWFKEPNLKLIIKLINDFFNN